MKKTILIVLLTLLIAMIGITVLSVALEPEDTKTTATVEKPVDKPAAKTEDSTFIEKKLPSKKEYEQVKQGMTIAQVDQVLGKPTDSSETEMENFKMTTNTYSAKGDLGASIIISFDNGKVTSKSQFGLK